jgi:hypothetical protein
MEQKRMMTLDEKLAVGMRAHEYLEAGNKAEAVRVLERYVPCLKIIYFV